jgi:hypothetical protein
MNNGIVTKGNGSNAVHAACAIRVIGISAMLGPATVATPAANGIGTPMAIANTKITAIRIGPLTPAKIDVSNPRVSAANTVIGIIEVVLLASLSLLIVEDL